MNEKGLEVKDLIDLINNKLNFLHSNSKKELEAMLLCI